MRAIIIDVLCKHGSTGTIAYGLYKYLNNNNSESIVCYGRGNTFPDDVNLFKISNKFEVFLHAVLARITGLQGFFSKKSTRRLKKIIEDFNPDIIYLLDIHGYYIHEKMLFNILSKKKIPTVYIMPDEYAFLGKCCFSGDCDKYLTKCFDCPKVKEYPKSLIFDQSTRIFEMKEEAYRNFDFLAFVSVPYNIQKAKESKLLSKQKLYAHNWGIDLENVYFPYKSKTIREKYNIPQDGKMILAVAPFTDERKGIKKYFLKCAELCKDEKIFFVNVGFNGDKAMCPNNFIPIEYIDKQSELAKIYSEADLFVITSTADTMPLSALMALGCGTPVCGFNISGIKYLKNSNHCRCVDLVEPGNINDLIKIIKKIPIKDDQIKEYCRNYALKNYSDNSFYKELVVIGNELIKEKNTR